MLKLPPTIWIIVQALLALGGAALWLAVINPTLTQLRERRLILAVWGPVILVTPLLFLTAGVRGSIDLIGQMAIGGPALIGVVAVAAALLFGPGRAPSDPDRGDQPGWFALTIWIGTGVVLLLLSAADVLNVMVGQCIFAAGAVVLWINTPTMEQVHQARGSTSPQPGEGRAAGALFAAMVLAVGQGLALLAAGAEAASITGGIALGSALVVVIGMVARRSAADAMTLGGWSASLGVLFALGLLSLLHMLPSVSETLAASEGPRMTVAARSTFQVARGFAAVAPEATALVMAGLAATFAGRLPAAGRRLIGAVLAVLTACLLLVSALSAG